MIQKLQLAEQPPKPERVPAERLMPGQFLAAGALTTGRPTEVLFTDTYPLDGGGRETLIVHRALGVDWPSASTVKGNRWFDLAAEADLARFRANVERAQKIADIRAMADWLDDNPEVPLAAFPGEQVHLHGDDAVAQVRAFAAKFGVEVSDHLDDRTQATAKIGSFEYELIAWHRDGRPAEPAPEPLPHPSWPTKSELKPWESLAPAADRAAESMEPADPTGLLHSRADDGPDDPTPVSGARVEPHTGGVLSGIAQDGHRLGEPGAPVDETLGACSSHWHDTEVDDYPEKCPSCGAVD